MKRYPDNRAMLALTLLALTAVAPGGFAEEAVYVHRSPHHDRKPETRDWSIPPINRQWGIPRRSGNWTIPPISRRWGIPQRSKHWTIPRTAADLLPRED